LSTSSFPDALITGVAKSFRTSVAAHLFSTLLLIRVTSEPVSSKYLHSVPFILHVPVIRLFGRGRFMHFSMRAASSLMSSCLIGAGRTHAPCVLFSFFIALKMPPLQRRCLADRSALSANVIGERWCRGLWRVWCWL